MSKDILFRHIIQFAALSFNLIYINVFLVFTRMDCLILNFATFGLFCRDIFMQPGLHSQSWVSAIFLSLFAIKFNLEAQKLKDSLFSMYYQMDQTSKQWIGIFERLPIGVLLINGERVVHFNDQMSKIVGKEITKEVVSSVTHVK